MLRSNRLSYDGEGEQFSEGYRSRWQEISFEILKRVLFFPTVKWSKFLIESISI